MTIGMYTYIRENGNEHDPLLEEMMDESQEKDWRDMVIQYGHYPDAFDVAEKQQLKDGAGGSFFGVVRVEHKPSGTVREYPTGDGQFWFRSFEADLANGHFN